MRKNFRKLSNFALAAGLTSALSLAGQSAAFAALDPSTLPSNNSLYLIDEDSGDFYEMTASGAQKKLDLQIDAQGFIPAGALNPKNNIAYYVDEPNFDSDDEGCVLRTVDLGGGPVPQKKLTIKSGSVQLKRCYGLNIDAKGNALIEGTDDDGVTFSVWKLNLTTGKVTNKVQIQSELYGFTVDPSGQWFGITDTASLEKIDKVAGTFDEIISQNFYDPYDAKLDSAGTLWFTNFEDGATTAQLYSWQDGDLEYRLQGDTSIDGDSSVGKYGPVFVGVSVKVIKKEQAAAKKAELASTGSALEPMLGMSIVMISAGVALLVVRRNSKKLS